MKNYIFNVREAHIRIVNGSGAPSRDGLLHFEADGGAGSDGDPCAALCRLLIDALRPACIFRVAHQAVAGSAAKQYLNLIVLLPDHSTAPIREYEPILQLAQHCAVPVHCSFHRVHTVADRIRNGHPFYCRYLVPQNLVYSHGPLTLPQTGALTLKQARLELRRRFTVSFRKAIHFDRSARSLHELAPEDPAVVTFMLHQAVELGYRSVLESLNGYCRKTHRIRRLRTQTFRCAPVLGDFFPDDTDDERMLLDTLESAYLDARYRNDFRIDDQMLDVLLERVPQFLNLVAQVCEAELGEGAISC